MQKIFVCTNLRQVGGQPSCRARGSDNLVKLLEQAVAERDLPIEVKTSVCFGHCEKGPNVKALGQPFWHEVSEEDIPNILDSLI